MDEEKKQADKGITEGEAQLLNLQKERDEYLEGWKRAKADLINYKKDEAARLAQFLKFSNESLITELIIVLDSFDLSLAVLAKDPEAVKGVTLIKSQLEDLLRKYGLEKMNLKVGDVYDPGKAEAIEEVESQAPPGTIAEVVGEGYLLHGKVIRPARVKLASSK
jgi:molecular chaperone GrpE